METWFSPELAKLVQELEQRGAYVALLLALPAAPLAWGLVRLLRGPQPRPHSIWIGRNVFDGVLFPLLWLAFTDVARLLCRHLGLPLAIFRVVIPILLSLVLIRVTVRVIRAVFPSSPVVRAVERTVSWLAWLLMVAWVTGLLPSLMDALDEVRWKTHAGSITLLTVIEGALSAGFVLVIVLWVSASIERWLLKGALGTQLSWRKAAANAVRALLIFVGLLLSLSAVGIDLTALSVFGGAIGVGLGFGLQKLASNYVSGFVILAERALRIGDTVKVDGFEGTITDIATRYTVLRAPDGRESIVPNELFITQRVESASLTNSRLLAKTVVRVAHDTDLDRLLPRIVEVVGTIPRVLADPAPGVGLSAFAPDGLELTVVFWIGDPENGTGGPNADVNLALLRLFRELGVQIPYPQRVVHQAPGSGARVGGPALASDDPEMKTPGGSPASNDPAGRSPPA